MKKILLLFAALLPMISAVAEVTLPAVSTETEKHYYLIKNARTNKYATYNGDLFQLKQVGESELSVNSLWYVTADGDNYRLHNAVTDYKYEGVSSFSPNGATVYIKENPYKSGYVCVSLTEDLSAQCWDDQKSGTAIGYYAPKSNDNVGTSWTFVAVEEVTTTNDVSYTLTDELGSVFTGTYDCVEYNGIKSMPKFLDSSMPVSNEVWGERSLTADFAYSVIVSNANIENKSLISSYNGTTFYWYSSDNTNLKVTRNSTPTNDNVNNYLWAIYPALNNGLLTYTIKHVGSGKFVYCDPSVTSTNHSTGEIVLSDEEKTEFVLSSSKDFKVVNRSAFISVNSSTTQTEQNVGLYGNAHNGTIIKNVPYTYRYKLSDVAGNVWEGSKESLTTISALSQMVTISGVADYTLAETTLNKNVLSTTITFPFAVSSETIVNPTLIGQGAWAGADKKWTEVDGNVKVVNGTAQLGKSFWAIYPFFDNGAFTFKIMSASTGKYVTVNLASGNDEKALNTPVTLTETGTNFSYISTTCQSDKGFSYTNNSGTTMYITRNGSADNNELLGVYKAASSHRGNGVRFPELNSYTFTVGAAGYASLYTPIAGTISGSNAVKTYAITEEGLDDGFVRLSELTGVAANQGTIVEAAAGTYTFTAGAVESDWSGNLLTGTSVNTYVSGDAYVLSAPGGVANIGLYKALLNKNAAGETGDTHFLNNAGKAYLKLPTASAVKAFLFRDNTATGIETLAPATDVNAPIYDLSGRRVLSTMKGGIYIQNGKKFIVK